MISQFLSIPELLEGNGFGYVWYNQDVNDEHSFISAFKERLLDIDIQCWRYDIEEMNKLRTYRLLKENLTCEIYLNEINIATYRKAITKLRGGLLDYLFTLSVMTKFKFPVLQIQISCAV